MGKNFDKFILLLWKNWKLQYRRPLQTMVEIGAPILFSILLVVLRSLVDPVENPAQVYLPFDPLPSNFFAGLDLKKHSHNTVLQNFTLVYSPRNKILDDTMQFLKTAFKNITGFQNSEQLEAYFGNDEKMQTLAAVQFNDELYGKDSIPHNVEVSLRFPSELRTLTGELSSRPAKQRSREAKHEHESVVGYYAEGFLALQILVTYFLLIAQMRTLGKLPLDMKPPIIQMRRFPYEKWREDPLLPALISFVGMLIMLSFVYTCINTVKVIASEKEKQLKEAMKIMGLPNWLHWTAWFIKSFSFLLTSAICIVVLLTVSWYPQTSYSLFTHANPIILFLFFIFYICATITFCFSVSAFFSKANTAATVAGLVWFLSYSPYLFLQPQYDQLSLSTKLIVSLGSNTAMAYGFQIFLMYEGTSEGIQWHNIWTPSTPDDSLSLGLIMVMLFVDTLIYLLIALYVEVVFPGEFGTPQPWYFLFTASYWCGKPQHVLILEDLPDSTMSKEFFEKNPPNLNPGIQIKNLRKVFGKKVAVNNLSLNIYDDQITALLGHNGAGKTSTMSMLTGIIPVTSGTAVVRGFDIRTNMKDVRANLGLCPQHNVLFDDLTVKEHLYFFGKLKGLHKHKINEEINKYVQLLDLMPKMNKRSSTLSGGMKRKLCVGIALCGGSKVVLLDEPTAGMDPSSRRALWDLLQVQKKGRCILLTTHYMDEADLLGDRIAIMANGDLKSCGTSFFLKKKYGAGYHLILDKNTNCEPKKVTALLQKYIPDIQVHRDVGSELVYLLREDHVRLFQTMLHDLEQNTETLGIRSYGISLTTLEDVFMKVGSGSQSENVVNVKVLQESKTKISGFDVSKLSAKKVTLLTGPELLRNQFIAMLMKKSLSFVRTWLLQFIQILIPVTFLIIAILVSRNMNKNKIGDLPKMPFTLDNYRDPVTVVQDDVGNSYSKFFYEGMAGRRVINVTDIVSTMLNLSRAAPSTVSRQYIVGASFTLNENKTSILTAWFNNNPYHTPPLALGFILNAVYRTVLGKEHTITFSNYPLPFTADTKVEKLLKGNGIGFQVAFNIGFSMSFVSSFYILFYVKERVCKSKHLQFASGVKSYIFWTTAFLCDLLTFILTILAIIITLLCFQEEGFRSAAELGRMFLMLFYFGFAVLPMIYFASYLFDLPSTGYTRMTLFSVFTGVADFLIVQILSTPGLELKYIADALHWGFLLVPHYSLATAIRDTYITFATSKMCNFFVNNCLERGIKKTSDDCWYLACHNESEVWSEFCCERYLDYYSWKSPGIGRNILYSFLSGSVLFVLLVLLEYRIFSKATQFFRRCHIRTLEKVPNEDEDVFEEKKRVRTTPETQLFKDYGLVLKDMTKYYGHLLAVNGLCLGVKQFECFGLLGINGAGKTTTFKMITGDINITYGNAWICGFSVKTHLKGVQKLIGYCPQFDALLTDLTAKETLIIYALLRGVAFNECQFITEKLAKNFDFYQHLNKKVKHLSGGNKRKLSTAISLIGDPPVLCLDEPTAGMDPVTKRNLWNALCDIRDNGKCILFTSHSMEECEALCTRLAIMVNGNFKCLGSVQHLKNKFAAGYTLTIKIKLENDEANRFQEVEAFVTQNFPTAKQQEKHQELVTYYIVDKEASWSQMFGILEDAKDRLNIEDYSLGQASLEQIFLTLTKFQR